MAVIIEEIIKPTTQGKSRPYYCRGSDGNFYCVKGLPRSSQGAEWIGAHIAKAFGLPVPPFSIVDIPEELLREAPDSWQEMGAGPAFGSRWVDSVTWLEPGNTTDVDIELQRDILVFDWWVKNPDRTPFNPNLLLKAPNKEVVVIDHNLAFDEDGMNLEALLLGHIFKTRWGDIDLDRRARYHQKMLDSLPAYELAKDTMPGEWNWYDTDQTVESDLSVSHIDYIVNLCKSDKFWEEV